MPAQVTPFSEKRRFPRARRLRRGSCVFNNATSTLDVVVRNIAPEGARIAGHELFCLPHTFELRILDETGGYSARMARIVWRDSSNAGLAFVD
jgi:hypothetical protein